jgi:hypothetical protein
MGYSPGEFTDDQGHEWHLEASSGLIIIQNPDEMAPAMRLKPDQAAKMLSHLSTLMEMYDG